MIQLTHHLYARPVHRQNARRHIIRVTGAYRRHYEFSAGRAVRARAEVIVAFQMHVLASRRALLARAEGA